MERPGPLKEGRHAPRDATCRPVRAAVAASLVAARGRPGQRALPGATPARTCHMTTPKLYMSAAGDVRRWCTTCAAQWWHSTAQHNTSGMSGPGPRNAAQGPQGWRAERLVSAGSRAPARAPSHPGATSSPAKRAHLWRHVKGRAGAEVGHVRGVLVHVHRQPKVLHGGGRVCDARRAPASVGHGGRGLQIKSAGARGGRGRSKEAKGSWALTPSLAMSPHATDESSLSSTLAAVRSAQRMGEGLS